MTQDQIILPVNQYDESSDPKQEEENPRWAPMEVKADNRTEYSKRQDKEGNTVIRAESKNAASGLIYKVDIDPSEYPVIEWRWRVDNIVEGGDVTKKSGDDYAARIYVTFDYDKANLGFTDWIKYMFIKTFTSYNIPLRAINYIWANDTEKSRIVPNPFTDWVQMVVVRNGSDKRRTWITETRNILEDYRKIWGEDPPRISGVAIMTDTDNTGGEAVAWYGDIVFKKE
ncbi:DUF3047 domain-containing protein [Aliifodinibius sp. S!AR15-10]|uniref:DUF3047 domain-containing protein n=1 Tax=Aliifodinibius sp. S!AR15-10 TaxID=2950437 RepID=UPI00285803AC|nr:DUF3047 domain-containing protein [Aliifodinibius sp. S!AR15-10]MDR8392932.1 DUF3047 domain-containing protein [Aliifodinibius sp. S!AR15-10]